MRRKVRKYLHDIQRAVGLLLEFTHGRSFQGYTADPMLRAAVEREFEIIGEALSRLAKLDPSTAFQIREHRRIIAFRNLLIHGYADIDDAIVWDVVQTKLPALVEDLAELLPPRD